MSNHLSLFIVLITISLSSQAAERIDPMRPDDRASMQKSGDTNSTKATTKAPARVSLWLQSIQIGEAERSANINGKLLKIGDQIRGARLIAIEHNQVQLRKGGELIILKFLPRKIKR